MPEDPKKFIVPLGWPLFFLICMPFTVFLVLLFVLLAGYSAWSADVFIGLAASGVICIFLYSRGAVVFARIDNRGVSWWSSGRGKKIEFLSLGWRDIDACAYKNEKSCCILQIFPCQPKCEDRSLSNPLSEPNSSFMHRLASSEWKPWFKKVDHVDIDFSLADKPELNLDRAFRSCADWIEANREGVSHRPSVRDFVESTTS